MLTERLCCICLCFMFFTIASVFTLSGEACPCRIDCIAKTADCTRRNLTYVPDCVPRYIKKLLFSGNNLYAILPRQFDEFSELIYLDLGYNAIAHLCDEALTGLPVLDTLMLNDNVLLLLDTTAFIRLSKLHTLDLSNNCLKEIKGNTFSELLNLHQLYLQCNQIKFLNASTFEGLSSLKLLNLSDNPLFNRTSFPLDVFQPVNKLEELVLISDFLTYGRTVYINLQLKWLTSLKLLNISDYPNQNLGLGFTFLRNLKELNMFRGSLSTISSETFNNLKNSPMRKLMLCRNKLSAVYPSTFTSMKHLESLSLTGNNELCAHGLYNITIGLNYTNIRHLQLDYLCDQKWELWPSLIEALQGTHLEVLDLSYSNLHVIYKGVYEKLPRSLLTLKLQGNVFLFVDLTHLNFLVNLRYLNISNDPTISKSILDLSISDENLNLKKQKMSTCLNSKISPAKNLISDIVFGLRHKNLSDTGVSSITSLDVSERRKQKLIHPDQNQYRIEENQCPWNRKTLDSSISEDYHNLKKQKYTSYSNINIKATKDKMTDTELGLRRKNISDQEVSSMKKKQELTNSDQNQYNTQEDECFPLPYKLNTIDLSNTDYLHWILNVLCDANNSLQFFYASNEKDPERVEELLKQMKKFRKLQQLYLNDDIIKNIPIDAFTEQTRMRVLSLSRNSLIEVNFDIRTLIRLEILDLSENMIEYIPSQFSQQIETIAMNSNLTVYLHGNNFSCKCDHLDFVTWLLHTRVIFRKDLLTCKYKNGSELALYRISDIHTQLEAECLALQVLLTCIIGFITLIVALSFIAIICHKRLRFKYLSLVGMRNINPFRSVENRGIILEYDIYLSYDKDKVVTHNWTLHELVTQRIYPSLEQRGLKVIIREELEIGRRLFDVISYALRRSRKIVVLLTNEYCKDHWNVFEFNMAVMDGIYTKRENTVLVMLEELSRENLHEEVYAFLRSGPIARFTFDRDVRDLITFLFESAR